MHKRAEYGKVVDFRSSVDKIACSFLLDTCWLESRMVVEGQIGGRVFVLAQELPRPRIIFGRKLSRGNYSKET